jgi:hypothetical protein
MAGSGCRDQKSAPVSNRTFRSGDSDPSRSPRTASTSSVDGLAPAVGIAVNERLLTTC